VSSKRVTVRRVQHACSPSRALRRKDKKKGSPVCARGSVPLAQTVDGFTRLVDAGHVRRWGVSNFDVADLQELWLQPAGAQCATNQVWYSASQRGVEFDLLPWQREKRLPTMAYSPIDQGTLAAHDGLTAIGRPHDLTAAQVALAWVLRAGDVIAIPKAARELHLRDNLAAADAVLTPDDLAAIDRLFAPPKRRQPLAMN